jgi:membrane-associated HD superfamily phosphohydrolase
MSNQTTRRNWRSLARTHPSAFLLAAQLISLVLYAVLDGSSNGRALLGVFGILILTLVVWVITRSPAINWIAWVLVAPAIVLSLLSIWYVNLGLLVWASLLEATLYFYAAGARAGDARAVLRHRLCSCSGLTFDRADAPASTGSGDILN